MTSLLTNLSFILPGLHLNIPKTEKMLQFGRKYSRRAWHVVPAQEVKLAVLVSLKAVS